MMVYGTWGIDMMESLPMTLNLQDVHCFILIDDNMLRLNNQYNPITIASSISNVFH
jgi:hypothetical protein